MIGRRDPTITFTGDITPVHASSFLLAPEHLKPGYSEGTRNISSDLTGRAGTFTDCSMHREFECLFSPPRLTGSPGGRGYMKGRPSELNMLGRRASDSQPQSTLLVSGQFLPCCLYPDPSSRLVCVLKCPLTFHLWNDQDSPGRLAPMKPDLRQPRRRVGNVTANTSLYSIEGTISGEHMICGHPVGMLLMASHGGRVSRSGLVWRVKFFL